MAIAHIACEPRERFAHTERIHAIRAWRVAIRMTIGPHSTKSAVVPATIAHQLPNAQ